VGRGSSTLRKKVVKMKNLFSRLVAAALCAVSASAFALDLPTTGACAFAIGSNYPFTSGQTTGQTDLNKVGTINFGTRSYTENAVHQTFNSTSQQRFVNTQNVQTFTFTSTPSSSVTGMYALTFTGLTGVTLNLIPVNNGKTVLMQFFGASDMLGQIGVCQF
jgi:hypothetical protein